MNYINRWRLLIASVILIFFIEYSPLVIPKGRYHPTLDGIPFSLWVGILLTIVVVSLTYIGSKLYSKIIEGEGE
jgi:hypothetical protein